MSGHTPGPWLRDGKTVYALMHAGWRKGVELFKNRFYASVQRDAECSEEESDANARLIAEAGTVAHETGLTPRQLAEHRAELLEALNSILDCISETRGKDATDAVAKARAAIAKAEGKQ